MFKSKYTYMGRYYQFNHIGIESFDVYKKDNGKLVKKNSSGSPYLNSSSDLYSYVEFIESKGYVNVNELKG